MGDSKDTLTKLELNDGKMQSSSAPDLLGNTMSSRESLDVIRAGKSQSSATSDYLPQGSQLLDLYAFDGSSMYKNSYQFDSSSMDRDVYKFDGVNVPGDQSRKEEPKKSYIQHHEKCGDLDLTIDARGELFGLKDKHHTFRRFGDEWVEDFEGGKTTKSVGKVEVNKQDGSYSFTNENGKYKYDGQGQLVEAPAGDGQSRKFHYDSNGQLDQIDGRLGHWDRQVINGQISWKNTNGTVWNGDFKATEAGLEFHADNGVSWGFTAQGKDLRLNPTDK